MRLYGSMTSIIKGLFGHGFEVKISNVVMFFFSSWFQLHKGKCKVVRIGFPLGCGFAKRVR